MYAVIESGGKQYRVSPGDVIRVEKLAAESGQTVELDRVLLVAGEGGQVKAGTPWVAGAKVKAVVKGHGRGEKIWIFKLRRRKNSRRNAGHRQHYTDLQITDIEAR
jgi:large subunit ribosomal protein L21